MPPLVATYHPPVTAPALPATIGRYEILGPLGRGAMGLVLLARDPNVDRELALKVMAPRELASDEKEQEELRQRFLQEARAAGRLNHPGIVMVHDSATDPATGWPYIAMELVVGRSLEQVLQERGALSATEVVAIGTQVAEALGYAHERGVIHRDVKPGNILIADDGRIKVTDFGIAKLASQSLTLTGHVMGSPFYMSPEQIRGDAVDGRTDLFSLGAVLYKAATGKLPFGGDSIATVAFKVVNIDHRPVDEAVTLPSSLVAVIDRCLAKDPDQRFQDGRQLAAALAGVHHQAAAGAGGAPAHHPRPPERTVAGSRDPQDGVLDGTIDLPAAEPAPTPAPAARGAAAGPVTAWALPPTTRTRLRMVIAGVAVAAVAALAAITSQMSGSRPELGDASPTAPPRRASAPDPLPPSAPPTPTPLPAARLELRFRSHLASGSLAVWVDGERVWLHQVEEVRNPMRRVAGQELRHILEVSAGDRTVEVRVTGRAAGRRIDAARSIVGSFPPDASRSLRVVLNPLTRNLDLEWGG
jgi:tRNA A-37 threonylcarbamoyl transferase component Bud32